MPLGREVGLSPSDTVLDGDPAPLANGAEPPNFRPVSTVAIKMPHGIEVGLSPGHTVLHEDAVPLPQRGHSPPIFGPCLLWSNGWTDQDTTRYRGRPRPGHNVLHGDAASPIRGTGRTALPNFWPMSTVAKRSPISATAELLSNMFYKKSNK